MSTMVVYIFVAALPSLADSPEKAADRWVEQLADKGSSDFLRKLEKDAKIDKTVGDVLKGTIKNFLKRKLKERLVPGKISQAMETILKSIRNGVTYRRGISGHQIAAVNIASQAFTPGRLSYSVRGAANEYPGILGSAGTGSSLLAKLGKTVADKLVDAVKKTIEKKIDAYLATFRVETFAATWSQGLVCPVTVRVVWFKQRNEFRYLLLGECKCKTIKVSGRQWKLSKWRITGTGRARWSEAIEIANQTSTTPQSTLSGAAVLSTKRDVRAKPCVCPSPRRISGVDAWDFSLKKPSPQQTPNLKGNTLHGSKNDEPKTWQNPPPEVLRKQGKIPIVPDGPVSSGEKDRLLRLTQLAVSAWRAQYEKRNQDLDILKHERKKGKRVSDDEIRIAKDALKRAKRLKDAAEAAHKKTQALKTTKDLSRRKASPASDKPSPEEPIDDTQDQFPKSALIYHSPELDLTGCGFHGGSIMETLGYQPPDQTTWDSGYAPTPCLALSGGLVVEPPQLTDYCEQNRQGGPYASFTQDGRPICHPPDYIPDTETARGWWISLSRVCSHVYPVKNDLLKSQINDDGTVSATGCLLPIVKFSPQSLECFYFVMPEESIPR